MGHRFKDRVAIVTGAGRGIGRAEAIALAQEGAKVVVNDLGGGRDGTGAPVASPADEVVAEIKKAGGQAVASYDSVATAEGGENIVKTAVNTYGRLDILVNNAGVLRDKMIFSMTEEDWDIVLKVHLYGHFHTTRPACAIFREQRSGRIINISSVAGLMGNAGQTNYAASKAGLLGYTKALAREVAGRNITVNAVAPGRIDTPMIHTVSDEENTAFAQRTPLGRLGTPQDVAGAVVFLASDEASFITGEILDVNGGLLID